MDLTVPRNCTEWSWDLQGRQISDMPHPRKRINSGLNEINMVNYDYYDIL